MWMNELNRREIVAKVARQFSAFGSTGLKPTFALDTDVRAVIDAVIDAIPDKEVKDDRRDGGI